MKNLTMKKVTVLRSFATIIAVVLLFSSITGNAYTASAAEGSAKDVAAETADGNTSTTSEKQLVQYSDNWTIFQYLDDEGRPMFDVKYLDKTAKELESNNMRLQYRTIYHNDQSFERAASSWYNLDYFVSEEVKSDIETNKTNYYIQFRIINADSTDTIISNSDTLLIWPQEESFPYILSSSIDYCNIYDLFSQPNELVITLKFSDTLKDIDNLKVIGRARSTREELAGIFSVELLSAENITENALIEGKNYNINFSKVSFKVILPSSCIREEENISASNEKYIFSFLNVEGIHSQKEPSKLILTVKTPKLPSNTILVESIAITAPTLTVKPGDSFQLTTSVLPENAAYKNVLWFNWNPGYSSIDEDGFITFNANSAGETITIIANANDGSGVFSSITFTVEGTKEIIPVTEIQVNSPSSTVKPGKNIALSATVSPSDATNQALSWSSSNPEYATVNDYGTVTAREAGAGKYVTITAESCDGSNIKGTYILYIENIHKAEITPVTAITLNAPTNSVIAGKKVTLTATVSPANATNKSVIWSSSNTKYATVDANGVVTTKKAGAGKTVTITAKSMDGSNKTTTFKLKIKKVSVKKLKITGKKSVKAGKKITLKVTVTPSNATNKSVKWTSSNKKYATVNSKGIVTAKKAGKGKTVKITATAKDGSKKKATIKIKIK